MAERGISGYDLYMRGGVVMATKKRGRKRARPAAKAPADRFMWTADQAAWVREARLARGMTVAGLAALIHRSTRRVYELEHAHPGRGPNKALRAALARALAPAPARPRRAGKKPHLVAAVVLEEPAQAEPAQGTEEACGLAAMTRAGRPAEGACPDEDEMNEEARLAALAGHPIDAAPDA
jgi:hypothetical protein